MIKRFLTDFSLYPMSPRWLWKWLQTQILLLCMYQTLCVCVCVCVSVCVCWSIVQNVECMHYNWGASRRRTKPGWFRMSPFIRRSVTGGKPWEPKLCFKWDCNCWGHYPFTLKPFSLRPYVCLYTCAYMCVQAYVCVCVCVLPLPWKPSEPRGAVKNQYSSAALPLYSFNNSLPLHYCSTDLPSQGPDWHLCALLPHWSLM